MSYLFLESIYDNLKKVIHSSLSCLTKSCIFYFYLHDSLLTN